MQTFAAVRSQEGAMGAFVVPRLVAVAGFHCRDDMHQAGMIAAVGKHLGDDVLLADMALGNVLDGYAGGTGQCGSAGAHPIPQRFSKSRIVEDPDLPSREKCRHSLRIADPRQGARDDDPVIAGEHASEALAVPLRQVPQPPLPFPTPPTVILSCLVPSVPAWGEVDGFRLLALRIERDEYWLN